MEITNAVIVLFFIVSIFGSLGKQSTPQYSPAISVQKISDYKYENLPSPSYTFLDTFESQAKESIKNFIFPRAKKISQDETLLLVDSIIKYSKEYDINPKLVTALIDRESSFNPSSVSTSNAQGLAQLLPSTAKDIGIQNPFDIEEGAKGAAMYLKMMMNKWRGLSDQVVLALASYAEGYNQIFRADHSYSIKTAQYVKDILNRYQEMD